MLCTEATRKKHELSLTRRVHWVLRSVVPSLGHRRSIFGLVRSKTIRSDGDVTPFLHGMSHLEWKSRATPTRGRSTVYRVSTMLPALGVLRTRICGSRNYLARNASETESEQVFCFC